MWNGGQEHPNIDERLKISRSCINADKSRIGKVIPENLKVITPLLQQYGVKTEWIDIVDNIWVALWFGSHSFSTSCIVENHEHIHICDSDTDYVYILLILSDAIHQNNKFQGLYEGDETNLVDLRKVFPSSYLRPHSQHGLMLTKKALREGLSDNADLSEYIVAAAKIERKLVVQWLEGAKLLSAQTLFPSVNYDDGYRNLLKTYNIDSIKDKIPTYGSIQLFSY